MASFVSILSNIGKGLKKVFGVAVEAAQVAEPVVDIIFPGYAIIYNSAVAAAVKAEAVAITAGQQEGTGAQKFAIALQEVEPIFTQWYQSQYGQTPALNTIETWLNAVVATLNAIPAPTTQVAAAPTTTAAPSVQTQVKTGSLL